MVFDNTRKYAFAPQFKIGTSETLQVNSELKVLGVFIQSDLKWGAQIKHMTNKASKNIWLLRRMKQLGVVQQTITNYWKTEGRCHLEASAPVWSGGITTSQKRDLFRVQRRG